MLMGRFRKKTFWNILCFPSGLVLIALFLFLKYADSEAGNDLYFVFILGTVFCVCCLVSLLFNHGAFVQIEENHIRAKFHWFGKLDCCLDDIAFVMTQTNTLSILMKNGKRQIIMGLENPWPLSSAIRKHIFSIENAAPDTLRQQLEALQAARKKGLYWVICGAVLMFINIGVTVLLTGGREFHDFRQSDWTVFMIFGILELFIVGATFYAAQHCGKYLFPIEQLRYRLKGALIATLPLSLSNIKRIYTDANNTGRIIVCGFPQDNSVYYCIQEFTGIFSLETVYTSEIYENEDALPNKAFSAFIDISNLFIQS